MARIRSVDTTPELHVRRIAHRLGYRFRLHRPDLPGKPDLVFPRLRKIIFVHGCFWHGHKCRRGDRPPRANADYWRTKIGNNVRRDQRRRRQLQRSGWGVMVIWECQLRDARNVEKRIARFLASGSAS